MFTNQPVLWVIMEALPHTLELVGVAMVVSHIFAVIIGTIQGYYRNTWFDHAMITVSFFFWSMPIFWLGILIITVFSVDLNWFPSGGISNPRPGFVRGTHRASGINPDFRDGRELDALHAFFDGGRAGPEDYVRTGRSKGASDERA